MRDDKKSMSRPRKKYAHVFMADGRSRIDHKAKGWGETPLFVLGICDLVEGMVEFELFSTDIWRTRSLKPFTFGRIGPSALRAFMMSG